MQDALAHIHGVTGAKPRIAVVLGSGLGAFADELTSATAIPYSDIPGWPAATAIGHAGKLVFGSLETTPVVVMSGRNHLYEGYTAAQVTFGVRLLHQLGIRSIVFTNAAGGINLSYSPGSLVLISDHINLQGANPLIGPNDDSLGPRFPDMTDAYSREYRALAHETAHMLDIELGEGVYAALTGPSYETPAEISYLRIIGADLVGMSTVPEVIVANHIGMRVLAISCVSNMAAGILPRKISHEEVLETGRKVQATLVSLLKDLLPKL
jgi:purine-nucleoside phosphorylase